MNVKGALAALLDPYDRRARGLPALLTLLPPVFLIAAVQPSAVGSNWLNSALSILVFFGAYFMLARISRNAGKRIQDRLFAEWSGPPTTQLLRHRDRRIDVHTKRAIHAKLTLLTGHAMPSAQDEISNPSAADELYRAATAWLISRTRDKSVFDLLFRENTNFGFQRNALGLKWLGISFAIFSAIWVFAQFNILLLNPVRFDADALMRLPGPIAASLLVSLGMLLVWTFAVTSAAAQRTGFAYAERLLESVDRLGQ